MGRTIGIKDVALVAGVSVTTVAHVLDDAAYARVSPETRSRVKTAAQQLGYGPNRLAQALRSRRSGILGLVSEDIATTPHAGRIILGADKAARARGYTLMVINTSGTASSTSRESDVQALLERQVDGILYTTMYHRTVQAPPAWQWSRQSWWTPSAPATAWPPWCRTSTAVPAPPSISSSTPGTRALLS